MGNDSFGDFLANLESLLGDGIREVSVAGDVDENVLSQLRELDGREVTMVINVTGEEVPMRATLKELGTAESTGGIEQGRFRVMVTLKP